jgi:hypothetical protein
MDALKKQELFGMATSLRHNKIAQGFIGGAIRFEDKANAAMTYYSESCALVYGKNLLNEIPVQLFDAGMESIVKEYGNMEAFLEVMDALDFVQPDFMVFQNNPFVINKSEWKIAGQPDFIAEIWSESNTKREIDAKKALYSTGPKTEHWYVHQNKNVIERWFGKERLANKSMTGKLLTKGGIEFDFRKLAIKAKNIL